MEWREEYEIGIEQIDNQHKHIFFLVNDLKNDMLLNKADSADLSNIMSNLVTYCIEHFECEEDIMENMNYEGIAVHKLQHKNLIKELKSIIQQIEENIESSSIQLYCALCQWLLKHFINDDNEFREYVRNTTADSL